MAQFNDYMSEIRASQRLKKTLELFKKGELTIEEATDFIASDAQFHKQEIEERNFNGYGSGTLYPYGGVTTINSPWITNPASGTITYTSGSISGPNNSTP